MSIRPYLQLAIAQSAIAVNFITAKLVIQDLSFSTFLAFRFTLAAFFLAVLVVIGRTPLRQPGETVRGFHLFGMFWQSMFGGLLFNLLMLRGVQLTSASTASIIASAFPGVLAVCSYVFLREEIARKTWIAVFWMMVGLLVLNTEAFLETHLPYRMQNFFGIAIILLALLPEALYSIIGKCLGSVFTPLGAGFLSTVMNAVVILPFAILECYEHPSLLEIALQSRVLNLIVLNAIGACLFFVLWPAGLRHVPASKAALFGGLMPVVASILAYPVLGEVLSLYEGIGMLMILYALWYGQRPDAKRRSVVNSA